MSSAAASVPVQNMTQYCSVKAGREMCSRVLAKEQENVRILNYSPGTAATDMIPEVKSKWPRRTQMETRKIHDCHDSVKVLVDLLNKKSFVNGKRVHIKDVLGN